MPRTQVFFFQDADGRGPVLAWLDELSRRDLRAHAKCMVRIRRLAELGYELRRPEADLLRDRLYELRIGHRHVNYRILYFFHGHDVAVLAHAITKEGAVPEADIRRALERRLLVAGDPHRYLRGN